MKHSDIFILHCYFTMLYPNYTLLRGVCCSSSPTIFASFLDVVFCFVTWSLAQVANDSALVLVTTFGWAVPTLITQYTVISVVDYIWIPFDFWCFNRSRLCCPIGTNYLVWFVSPVLWPFATMLPLSTHMRHLWCRVPGLIWLCNISNTCLTFNLRFLATCWILPLWDGALCPVIGSHHLWNHHLMWRWGVVNKFTIFVLN